MNAEGIKGHQRQIRNLEFLLKNNKIPQAILFTGASGIGKRLLAKRFLNALFCKDSLAPCLTCHICKQIAHETFPDFLEIRPNEKGIIPIGGEESREKGSVRWLIERLSAKSISGRTGILIDGIDKITEDGQNALLKTIEEPSEGTCFILISSYRNNLLPTILSRCTEIRFFPLTDSEIREILIKKDLSNKDPELISKISGGSLEIAEIISNNDVYNKIIEICTSISSFLTEEKIINVDIGAIQKTKIEFLIDVIINIFRQNLLMILKQNYFVHKELREFFIDDMEKLINLLKILIFLKQSGSHNLNFKYAFKGLLYSLIKNNTFLSTDRQLGID